VTSAKDRGAVTARAFLAVGDLCVDSVALVDHLPVLDEKIWLEPGGDHAGGMMGNAAATVATLGVPSAVAALIGSDDHGQLVLDELHRRGVATDLVRQIDAPTFWTLSVTVPSGDRTLLQFRTPAFGADWDAVDDGVLGQIAWLHTVAEFGLPAFETVRRAHLAGVATSLDVEHPFVLDESLPEVLPFVDVAFVNGGATDAMGGVDEALETLRRHGARTVVATMGDRGAVLCSEGGERHHLAAHDVEAIDTNGAGDAFAGGFAAGRLKGFDELTSAQLGSFIAGQSTTVFGGFGIDRPLAEIRDLAKACGQPWWDRL
jgi:sugar/nucleoside kinase (ribokinase family)